MKIKIDYTCLLLSGSIVALSLGGIGGSFQPSRMMLLLLLPSLLVFLMRNGLRTLENYQFQVIIFSIALFLLSFITMVWSIDRLVTFQNSIVMAVNLIPVLLVAAAPPRILIKFQHILPTAWGISAMLVLPIAFYELITGNHFLIDEHQRGGGLSELVPFAAVFFGNLNNLSLYLFFCFFGISFAALNEKNKKYQIFIMTVGFLISIVIILNSGRATILALFGLLLITYFSTLFKKEFIGRFVLMISIIFGILYFVNDQILIIIEYLSIKFTDFSNDLESADGRLAILKVGIDGLYSSYGFGFGAGTSTLYLTQQGVSIPNAHNLYLEWALHYGLIGIFLLFWFIISIMVVVRKSAPKKNRKIIYSFVLLSPIWGLAQSHLIGFTYFWLALATMVAYVRPIVFEKSRQIKSIISA